MKVKNAILSGFLAAVMLLSMLVPSTFAAYAAEREREIVPVDSGNGLNMRISDQGLLTWDAVAGATGH